MKPGESGSTYRRSPLEIHFMKLQIKALINPEGTTEQPSFDPKNCSVRLWVEIGFAGDGGADKFSLQVVTPAFLRDCGNPIWGTDVLVVPVFIWDDVEREIEKLLAGISATTWEDAVKILSRYMYWEYEGM